MNSATEIASLSERPRVIGMHRLLRRNGLPSETMFALMRDQPTAGLRLLPQMLMKRFPRGAVDEKSTLDVTMLPYDEEVLRLLREERGQGRRIILAADGFPNTAARIANHLGVFDDVIAGRAPSRVAAEDPVESLAARIPPQLRDWMKALRLHQWLKNLLVLVPLVTAHKYTDLSLLFSALLAVLCFGLMASGVYILNDLLDMSDDRHHPSKRRRPFASGRISILSGLFVVPALTALALGLSAWLLPPRFLLSLGGYLVLTMAYSLVLKRKMIVDVISLAGLYTLRIVAGGFAIGVPLSFWLLGFSMFLFLSLALVKRYAELMRIRVEGSNDRVRGRQYWTDDLHMIASLGAAAGYMAVMVLALYVNDAGTTQLYRHPHVIWLACPLLLTWVTRVWMMAHRGYMNEDPLIFAVRDRVSLVLGAMTACIFWAAK